MNGRFGRWLLTVLFAASIPLLYSCGGGGGGGGGGASGSTDAFSLSSTSVSFNATQFGSAPAPQAVNLTVNKGLVFIATSQTGTGFGHFFTVTGQTSGQITITPSAPLTAGTFTGTITVTGCLSPSGGCSQVAGSPKVINVTYTVAGAPGVSSDPPTVDFITRTGALPASKAVLLSLGSGSSPWTASAPTYLLGSPNWLSVTPGGTLNPSDTVTFTVSDAASAEVRTATVTFTAGAVSTTVGVTLTINDPRANFVAPYVVPTGSGGNVIIRGYGFSTLNAGALQVLFGATPATTASVSSDTEILASYPALSAGSNAITVGDGSITLPSRPSLKLVAINAPAYSGVAILRPSSPGPVVNLIYDGERQAIYLMDADNRLERYTFVSGTTWNVSPLVVGDGGNARIALAPDGTQLIKTNGSSASLEVVDPVMLSSSTVAATFTGTPGPTNLGPIAFANDGGAVGTAHSPQPGVSLYRYDMLTQRFATLSTILDLTYNMVVSSADGDTLIMPTFDPLAPSFATHVWTYDASVGQLQQGNAAIARSASVSRDGSRVILISVFTFSQVTSVFNYNSGVFQQRGFLPADVAGFVISPDGNTAYAYFSATNSIRKFDLNALNGSDGFVETGSVSVASPGTSFNAMAITPDGGTLFLAGDQQVVIVPAP